MKIAIVNKSDLSIASWYEGEEPNQGAYGGPWGDPEQTVHVALAEGDHRAASAVLVPAVEADPEAEPPVEAVPEYIALEVDAGQAAVLAAQDQEQAVANLVAQAMHKGQELISKFATENVMLGITQDAMTEQVLDNMAPVMVALQSGSLYLAIERIKAMPAESKDAKYITDARLLQYVNKLEQHLNLPLSTEL